MLGIDLITCLSLLLFASYLTVLSFWQSMYSLYEDAKLAKLRWRSGVNNQFWSQTKGAAASNLVPALHYAALW